MAKTKATGKKRSTAASGSGSKRAAVPADPPIFVGGGGSTLIWVRNDFTLSQIPLAQVKADASKPPHPENYQIYECEAVVTTLTVKLNQGVGQSKHTGMDPKKFSTDFTS
jgi:hypothetical protein